MLDGLDIKWYKSNEKPDEGVVALWVSRIGPVGPALVKKTIDQGGNLIGNLFGYFERRQDRATHINVESLQSLIRDGRRLEQEIREGFQSLHSMIESGHKLIREDFQSVPTVRPDLVLTQETERATMPPPSEKTAAREEAVPSKGIESAVHAVELEDSPAFILWARPQTPIELHELFESRSSDAVRHLEKPPEIRPSGFDLDAGGNSRIVEGRLRRVLVPKYKLLEAWRDGTLIYVMRGDYDGLSWRKESEDRSLRLNQLVLVETTFLFFRLIDAIRQSSNLKSLDTDIGAQLRRMNVGGSPCILERGPLRESLPFEAGKATDDDVDFQILWSHDKQEPAQAAFHLVSEIYHWFSIEDDDIPYTEERDGVRFISEGSLKLAGEPPGRRYLG